MPVFNLIEYTFPDGSHRWKYFTFGQSIDYLQEKSLSEDPDPPIVHEPGWTIKRKEIENARRAKMAVYDLARSNSHLWDWFITLTFDPLYVRRDDYRSCLREVRELTQRMTSNGMVWLFVPEHHKDGRSYHFHGLAGGEMELDYAGEFGVGSNRRPTYNIPFFPGYTAVQPIEDGKRASTYITKYITKDLVHLVPKGCHRYLHSRSLLRPTVTYHSVTKSEFTAMLNYGEYFDSEHFEDGLQAARYVKKVPMYYRLNEEFMYIVED